MNMLHNRRLPLLPSRCLDNCTVDQLRTVYNGENASFSTSSIEHCHICTKLAIPVPLIFLIISIACYSKGLFSGVSIACLILLDMLFQTNFVDGPKYYLPNIVPNAPASFPQARSVLSLSVIPWDGNDLYYTVSWICMIDLIGFTMYLYLCDS
jgi:hypothetical protein